MCQLSTLEKFHVHIWNHLVKTLNSSYSIIETRIFPHRRLNNLILYLASYTTYSIYENIFIYIELWENTKTLLENIRVIFKIKMLLKDSLVFFEVYPSVTWRFFQVVYHLKKQFYDEHILSFYCPQLKFSRRPRRKKTFLPLWRPYLAAPENKIFFQVMNFARKAIENQWIDRS